MPRPFANSQAINPALIEGDWLLGIQTGNNTGDSGLPQMKYIKLSQLTDWVRSTYGAMWRYRGTFSASLPSDPQTNDYFLATATFTVGSATYTQNHLYAYNGSTWDDVSDVLTQYASQAQVTDIDDRLTTAETQISAISGGITPKGDILSANLPAASSANYGWQYYCTDLNKYAVSNGTEWVYFSNNQIVQSITSGDTSHAPSADTVFKEVRELKNTSAWETDPEAEVVFEGDGENTWAIMERQIPTEPNDAFFLCEADSAPASSSSSGIQGQFFADANYFYICIADNTWRRVALSTF